MGAVLIAAEFDFAKSGFTEAKINAIAAAADVSLATVYENFDGKDDICDVLQRLLVGAQAHVSFFASTSTWRCTSKEGLSWATEIGICEAGPGGQRIHGAPA